MPPGIDPPPPPPPPGPPCGAPRGASPRWRENIASAPVLRRLRGRAARGATHRSGQVLRLHFGEHAIHQAGRLERRGGLADGRGHCSRPSLRTGVRRGVSWSGKRRSEEESFPHRGRSGHRGRARAFPLFAPGPVSRAPLERPRRPRPRGRPGEARESAPRQRRAVGRPPACAGRGRVAQSPPTTPRAQGPRPLRRATPGRSRERLAPRRRPPQAARRRGPHGRGRDVGPPSGGARQARRGLPCWSGAPRPRPVPRGSHHTEPPPPLRPPPLPPRRCRPGPGPGGVPLPAVSRTRGVPLPAGPRTRGVPLPAGGGPARAPWGSSLCCPRGAS